MGSHSFYHSHISWSHSFSRLIALKRMWWAVSGQAAHGVLVPLLEGILQEGEVARAALLAPLSSSVPGCTAVGIASLAGILGALERCNILCDDLQDFRRLAGQGSSPCGR